MIKPKAKFLLTGLLCVFLLTPVACTAQNLGQAGVRPSNSAMKESQLPQAQRELTVPDQATQNSGIPEYILGSGDKIRLTVFGETELSGEYELSSTGYISLPLIGDVPAAGQSTRHFEEAVRRKLAEGYLKDPRVSAQVINYRPFFILGEVAKPGSYPFVNGMTVVNAVALAGGYSYRADRKDIRIQYAHDPEKKEVRVREEAPVMPGDVIRVPERFF